MEPHPDETCAQCLSDELKPENIAPLHGNTRLFVDSQWTTGRVSIAYVVYRVVAAVLIVTWTIVDLLAEAGHWYSYSYAIWLVYATNWSLLSIGISSTLMAGSSVYYCCRSRQGMDLRKPIGYYIRVQWVAYNIAANSAIVVSISFWSFLLIFVNNDLATFLTTPMSLLKHSMNTIYIVVDLFANGVPIRIYHMLYPLLAGLSYAIFNAAYFTNDGIGPNGHHYAYDVMDWRNPLGSTVTCLLGFVLSGIVQFVIYGLYRARLAAHRRLNALMESSTAKGGYRSADIFSTVDGAVADDDDEISAGAAPVDVGERGPIIRNASDRGGAAGFPGYRSTDAVEMNGR